MQHPVSTRSGNPTERAPGITRAILWAVGIGLFSLFLTRASLFLFLQSDGITWIWPPCGLALAALTLTRRRDWALTLTAIFIANLAADLLAATPLPLSLAFSFVNCVQALLAASLLQRFLAFPLTFRRFNNVLIFLVVVLCSAALSALIAAAAAAWLSGAEFWRIWLTWSISTLLGAGLIVPLVAAWYPSGTRFSAPAIPLQLAHILEGLVLFVCLALTSWMIYLSDQTGLLNSVLRSYLIFPFLIWAALRFDQRYVTSVMVFTCLAAILGTLNGLGKFSGSQLSPADSMLPVQLYLLLVIVSTLNLSAALTENKLVSETFAKSEAEYYDLFQNASVGIFHSLPGAGFLKVNPALAVMLGYESPQDLIASVNDIANQIYVEPQRYLELVEKALQQPGWVYAVTHYRRKDGSQLTGRLSVRKVLRVADGSLAYLEGLVDDITERHAVENALRTNEQIMKLFVENAPAAIAMFDKDMRYMVASQRYKEEYGLGDQDLIGRSHYEVFPEISEHWKEIHRRCLAGAVEKMEDDPFQRPDGSLDYVRWEIRPWFSNGSEVGGIILISEVTTQRKFAEQALKKSETLLNETQAIAKVGGWVYDPATRNMTWTKEVYRIYGVPADFDPNDITRNISFYALQDRLVVEQSFNEALSAGKPYDLEVRFVNAQGRHRWVRTSGAPMLENGKVVKVTGTIMDISELKRAQTALVRSEEQLRLAMEASNDGLWDWRCQDSSIHFSLSYCRMLGYSMDEFPTSLETWLDLVHPDDQALVTRTYEDCAKNLIQSFEIEFRLRARVGGWKWLLSRAKTVSWQPEGMPLRVVGTNVDITERKQAEEALRRANRKLEKQAAANEAMQALLIEQATHDALTGLYNRRFMDDALQREILRANRDGRPVSVLMLDIDHFKNFNDSFGHDAGDQVLVALSSLLRVNIRESDIACRYGGEEFVVILPGASAADARHRAELIREDFSCVRIGPEKLSATISVGLSVYPKHGVTVDELLRAADSALYLAKNAGRNCVLVYPN
ncbi:MAG TPA: diguanylate cyclase [Anaerolineales bacterium]|jgi:diguanylate cyclase (GGDEF)-like protein/PAS domain S-box-containing protein